MIGRTWQQLQEGNMKTEEDEAFDELAKKQGMWGGGFQAKRQMAADKQEPPSEWASIKAILDEYGLQAIDFVADFKAALAQPQQEAINGMNQDDWKDVVAAITKARDGRGIYLGCRPADVFQEWFLALGTAKVKEKNT
jgi:hypothetical protein